jgi:hypothetical protein
MESVHSGPESLFWDSPFNKASRASCWLSQIVDYAIQAQRPLLLTLLQQEALVLDGTALPVTSYYVVLS